jgi:hypothetical protein
MRFPHRAVIRRIGACDAFDECRVPVPHRNEFVRNRAPVRRKTVVFLSVLSFSSLLRLEPVLVK